MKNVFVGTVSIALLLVSAYGFPTDTKTYKHASQYQLATLDRNLRVVTGSDVTVAKTMIDAKLDSGGQGIHLLYTDQGNYRAEAPVNKGRTLGAAFAASLAHTTAPTIHNKWFLDTVQPGTKVLFAAECAKPNKKHPNETVRCTFWFPDPDSADHEYETIGDFTPYVAGDGSNTQKTADSLCGTGKLKPDVERQICEGNVEQAGSSASNPVSQPR